MPWPRDQARDALVEKQWILHETVIGIRDQVKARYGKNSAQVQIIGLKREDEYKKRARKGSGSGGTGTSGEGQK